jgi:penicillin-binding protein 1A
MPRNLTLALGTQATTPLQMATGFAVFANGGFKVEPYFIERIEDATGKVVYQANPVIACAECERLATGPQEQTVTAVVLPDVEEGATGSPPLPLSDANLMLQPTVTPPRLRGMDDVPEAMRELASIQGGRGFVPEERLAPRAISAQNAWLMSDILHDVTVRGTARRSQSLGRDDLAGKTGTNEDRDNWFGGFTSNLVATVWVGYDDYRPLGAGAEGATTALPIWMHFMREALQGVPSTRPPRPDGLVDLRISPHTGARAHPLDPEAITETFMLNRLPPEPRPGDGFYEPGATGPTRNEPLF